MRKYRIWTDEQLIESVKVATSMMQLLKLLNLKISGGAAKNIKNNIKRLNLNTDHWTGQGWLKGKKHNYSKRPIEEILAKDTYYSTMFHIKNRLINDGHWKDECQVCNLSEWQGQKLGLQVHHVDGDRTNNLIENLQLLCPNCHSITDNYCGKESRVKKNVIPPTKYFCKQCSKEISINARKGSCIDCYNLYKKSDEFKKNMRQLVSKTIKVIDVEATELIEVLKQNNYNYVHTGKHYGVSKTTISNWVKRKGLLDLIPSRVNQYW